MIKNYFTLQYKMLNRQLADFGLPRAIAWIALPPIFVSLSLYLFYKTAFAQYIYTLIAASLTANFTGTDRNDFLRSCFKIGDYYRVRLGENILVVLPFLIFLICKNCIASAGILLALATATAFISFKNKLRFIIPTPFYKKPFEFISGFRKMWPALLCCYLVTIIAIVVHNFNLGVVALTAIFLLCISFYQEMETGFYVRVFLLTPHQFLKQKIATAAWQASLLTLPAAIALGICYPPHINIIGLFFCLGHIYLATAICAKYSAFPQPIALPQVILLVAGILFAPLLILIIPYFYIRSLKKLNNFLR